MTLSRNLPADHSSEAAASAKQMKTKVNWSREQTLVQPSGAGGGGGAHGVRQTSSRIWGDKGHVASALDLANGPSGHTVHCSKEGRQERRMERLYSLSGICCFHAGGVVMMVVMKLLSL